MSRNVSRVHGIDHALGAAAWLHRRNRWMVLRRIIAVMKGTTRGRNAYAGLAARYGIAVENVRRVVERAVRRLRLHHEWRKPRRCDADRVRCILRLAMIEDRL